MCVDSTIQSNYMQVRFISSCYLCSVWDVVVVLDYLFVLGGDAPTWSTEYSLIPTPGVLALDMLQ